MDRTDPGGGTAETRVSPAREGADPGRTGYDVSAMIGGCVTNGDQHDHRVVLIGQQAQLLDGLLGDGLLGDVRLHRPVILDRLDRLANAVGPPSRRS